ncbi:MAG: L-2-amino-thiazoline-4-carboxylic acid hydrolase [Clostridia bacterium]|nr:L-2-amino-thiazoline-4-carboxylic acid hydrolase [Clostridia bacterium]
MEMSKTVKKYGRIFRKILATGNCSDPDRKQEAYEKRLAEMYASPKYTEHNIYPTTNAEYIYAVIAMCLELKEYDLSDKEIIDTVNSGFRCRRNFFKRLIRCIDLLPVSYQIAKKWNISDHDKRVKDGSILYDRFDVSDGKIEYSISKCAYVEMFETYGIRSLCKIFCMTDTTAYSNLGRHVEFIRFSDLSDGNCCHDIILDKRKIKADNSGLPG